MQPFSKAFVSPFLLETHAIPLVGSALDLTGYGKTVDEAKESFSVTLEQFLNYSTNKNTLFNELKTLDGKFQRKVLVSHHP